MPFRHDPDEGPSAADQRKFGEDAVHTFPCPDCGAEVIDNADICPRCFAFIDDESRTVRRRPGPRRGVFHAKWKALLLLALIVSMVVGCSLAYVLGWFAR